MRRFAIAAVTALTLGTAMPAAAEVPVTLRGSPKSMQRQNSIAKDHGLTFVRTEADIEQLVAEGALVRVEPTEALEIADFVRWPIARPEMRLFLERLATQYHEATGEKLVVTSLTRPSSRQPRNSHALSVHPTGMAVDLRVSQRAGSRAWLESALLGLERNRILDVTREYNPPHYHVALFPAAYMEYVTPILAQEAEEAERAEAMARAESEAALEAVIATGGNRLTADGETASEADDAGRSAGSTVAVVAVLITGAAVAAARRIRPFDRSE